MTSSTSAPPPPPSERACRHWLDIAAFHASHAEGLVEPGVLVGCVIVPAGEAVDVASREEASRLVTGGRVAAGHHRAFGGPHGEVEALRACERLGLPTRGSTVFVTLEPCDSWGKTGPCTEALLRAGVRRVVIARADGTQGGAAHLRRQGVDVLFSDASTNAASLSEPFTHRVETGLPWVIGKWAQTLDGKSATSAGESQWLTGPRARRAVHALRGRVDAILTGIGTVLADDPRLTVRSISPRRIPVRVVIDPHLELPVDSRLSRTAREVPVIAVCTENATASRERALVDLGVRVHRLPSNEGLLDLRSVLSLLGREEGVATAMTECGPRLLGRLLDAGCVHELRAYIAPMVMGDGAALASFVGAPIGALGDVARWRLLGVRRFGDDMEARYRRQP